MKFVFYIKFELQTNLIFMARPGLETWSHDLDSMFCFAVILCESGRVVKLFVVLKAVRMRMHL